MGSSDRPDEGARTELYRHAGLGLQFAATLGVFGFAGYWLDGKWGTAPWLMILGIFSGFGLGLFSMIHKISSPPPKNRDPR